MSGAGAQQGQMERGGGRCEGRGYGDEEQVGRGLGNHTDDFLMRAVAGRESQACVSENQMPSRDHWLAITVLITAEITSDSRRPSLGGNRKRGPEQPHALKAATRALYAR